MWSRLFARSNAKGPDDIPVKFLKDCLPTILSVLLDIFDCSLQSRVFPSAWKTAIVRPLPKRWPPTEAGDFRPISILCAASKILETVAYKQISSYISVKSLLDPLQSGFRKSHSTHTTLIKIVDDIREAIRTDRSSYSWPSTSHGRSISLMSIYLLINSGPLAFQLQPAVGFSLSSRIDHRFSRAPRASVRNPLSGTVAFPKAR